MFRVFAKYNKKTNAIFNMMNNKNNKNIISNISDTDITDIAMPQKHISHSVDTLRLFV